jgi:hypothetical protein
MATLKNARARTAGTMDAYIDEYVILSPRTCVRDVVIVHLDIAPCDVARRGDGPDTRN